MLQNEQNETKSDANGVIEFSDTVRKSPATDDSSQSPLSDSPSKPSTDFLHDTLKQQQNESDALQRSIKTEEKRISNIDKDDIINEIMLRISSQYTTTDWRMTEEDIDAIGIKLISNYCSINATARDCRMSPAHLQQLIKINERLQVYYEIAHDGIKALTDEHLIEGLRNGDPHILRMVATRLYAGRSKGGYNISEIGTIGYKDKLAQQIASETERDRSKGTVNVQFVFNERERPAFNNNIEDDDAVDAEFEDVEKDGKQ